MSDGETLPFRRSAPPDGSIVQQFRLAVLEGPEAGRKWASAGDACSIGSHPLNALSLEDPTVSRFHCEVLAGPEGVRVRDLSSRNGTIVDGVLVTDAFLRSGSLLQLGRASIRFELSRESNRLPLSEKTAFGSMVGESIAMRSCFAVMERAAATDATVLLGGETGTGKSQAALAIHQAGRRAPKPFAVVDCGALPANLLESELFGHEKGAFTGAVASRLGAFEEAAGGTVLLEEIGELPLELQPKLLRVIENREIRRLGANGYRPVDVRLIAATHRDLRAEVNAGRFRPDLYFRLAVVVITLPPLRQRLEDIPLMVERMVGNLGAGAEEAALLRAPELCARLQQGAWPGNVRELRNYLERCLVLQDAEAPLEESSPECNSVDARQQYPLARRRALERFERTYAKALLQLHQGKVSEAARAADIDRVHLYRLLRRHGLKP